jgi:hypothetical protein
MDGSASITAAMCGRTTVEIIGASQGADETTGLELVN